jgi:hypothetical protein
VSSAKYQNRFQLAFSMGKCTWSDLRVGAHIWVTIIFCGIPYCFWSLLNNAMRLVICASENGSLPLLSSSIPMEELYLYSSPRSSCVPCPKVIVQHLYYIAIVSNNIMSTTCVLARVKVLIVCWIESWAVWCIIMKLGFLKLKFTVPIHSVFYTSLNRLDSS